jgi:hypothetical protein
MGKRDEDRKILTELSDGRTADFIFMHLRNMWTVDGLYYLGIEEEYGTDVATEIDRKVWKVMGKIEARRIKNLFNINGNDITSMMKALRLSSWALDLENKKIEIKNNKGIVRNTNCRVQKTRISKGLAEFACKPVRWGFLKSFAKEFNPNIEVKCNVCPPDKHQDDLWCEWEFTLKKID